MRPIWIVPVFAFVSLHVSAQIAPSSTAPPATQSDPADRPLRIGGGVSAPVVLHGAAPKFSEAAIQAGKSGNVLVHLEVDTSGNPIRVRVLRGLGYGLDEKAIEAVGQYRFKPAMRNGVPVLIEMNIEVNFQFVNRQGKDPS